MSLAEFYQKFKKKKNETLKPATRKVSRSLGLMGDGIKKAKNYFDDGIGKTADKALKMKKDTSNTFLRKPAPRWMRKMDKGLRDFSEKAENVPRFKFAEKIKNPLGSFAASIPQEIMNIPSRTVSGAFKDYGKNKATPSYLIKRGAEAADVGLDIATSLFTPKVGKDLAVKGFKSVGKKGLFDVFKQGAKKGSKEGFKYGTSSGVLKGLQEGDSVKEQLSNAGKGGVKGGVTGVVSGGVAGGVLPVAGKELKNMFRDIKHIRNPYAKRVVTKHDYTPVPGTFAPGGKKQMQPIPSSERKVIQTIKLPFEPKSVVGKISTIKPGLTVEDVNAKKPIIVSSKSVKQNKTSKVNQKFTNVLDIPKEEKLKRLGGVEIEKRIVPTNNSKSNPTQQKKVFNQYQQEAYKKKGQRINDLSRIINHSPELQAIGYKKSELAKIGVDQEKKIVELAKLGYPKNQIETLKGDWDRMDNIIKNNVSWSELKNYYEKKRKLDTNFLEGIDPSTIKDINPLMVGGRDVYRNLETAFGKNFPKIKERLLDPFDKAKGQMINEQKLLIDELSENIVKKFGVKKGSDLDKVIVEFGEGKISMEKLQSKFPKDWKKVVEADKWFRRKYSNLLEDLNKTREENFPTHPLYPESTKIIPERKDYYRHGKDLDGITGLKNMFETPASIDPSLAVSSDVTNPKTKWLSFAQKRKGDDNDFGAVEGYIDYIKNHAYAKHIDPYIQKFKGIDDEAKDMMSKNSFMPESRGLAEELSQKVDTVQQLTDFDDVGKIKDILTKNGVSERQSDWLGRELAEIKDYKKVKNFLQNKLAKNKNDALGKLTTERSLAEKSENQANNLLVFIKNFSRDLAGKTNPIDRPIQENAFGRPALRIINFLNSRFKANAVLGNFSSSVSQFFNIPQGVASAGARNSAKGLGDSLAGIFKKNGPIKNSDFINERYFDGFSKFDASVLDKPKKFAVWVTGIGDEIGTKFIWNSHYRKGLAENVANPVKYADDWTRKMVAGRGVGEVPIIQKSKMVQLIAPFQLEVANQWYALRDIARNDPRKLAIAKKLIEFSVASFLMNRAAKEIRGSDVSFDPINAMIEAYNEFSEEDSKTKGVLKAGGRMTGEVFSNIPGGALVSKTLMSEANRKKYLGDADPSRFGTGSGLIVGSGILSGDIATKEGWKRIGKETGLKLVPSFGGKQIGKTLDGFKTLRDGYAENKSGNIMTPIENSLTNKFKGLVFGKNALGEVQEYYDKDQRPLSNFQTEKYKLMGNDNKYFNKVKTELKTAKEKKELKIKEVVNDPMQLNENLFRLSNGKIYVRSLDKEFVSEAEAERAIILEDFKDSDANFMDLGDVVLRKKSNGEVTKEDKNRYVSSLFKQQLEGYKRSKNLQEWLSTADELYAVYEKMMQDPSIDDLEKYTIQNDMAVLRGQLEKYSGYGGFTKPKKLTEKYRYRLVDPEFMKIKALLTGVNRKPATSKKMLPLIFKSPRVVRRR